MPKVHYVKKARKDNPAVKKGESYYWWKFRYGGKRYSKTHPRQSQLTQSEHLSMLYEAEEMVQDVVDGIGDFSWDQGYVDGLVSAMEEASHLVMEVAESYMYSADNIREHFEESPVADECEEKSYACEEIYESIQEAVAIIQDLEFPDSPDDTDYDERVRDAAEDINWNIW